MEIPKRFLNSKNNKERTCCICNEQFTGYGHNPDPVKKKGLCCDDCNMSVVMPKRLGELFNMGKSKKVAKSSILGKMQKAQLFSDLLKNAKLYKLKNNKNDK